MEGVRLAVEGATASRDAVGAVEERFLHAPPPPPKLPKRLVLANQDPIRRARIFLSHQLGRGLPIRIAQQHQHSTTPPIISPHFLTTAFPRSPPSDIHQPQHGHHPPPYPYRCECWPDRPVRQLPSG
jgi:hypothetical protein